MRRLLIASAALAVLALAACDTGSGAGLGTTGGRVLVRRAARRTAKIADGPGWASYCPTDSLLLVIALGPAWNSGFAVRAALPLREVRTFQVQRSLGGPGTATAAFRPADAGAAQLAVGGTLRLEPSNAVTGSFEIAVPDSGTVHVLFRGSFSDIPVDTLPRGSCRST